MLKNARVIAHRGFSGAYPENTALAVRKAVELQAGCIEIDVRETKDGEIVVIHDETVNRTTGGEGPVKELTFEELKKLDAGKWKGNFENTTVPSLDEILRIVRGRTMLLIEIKEAAPEKIIRIIRRHKMESDVIIGSFAVDYLIQTRIIEPSIPTALIAGTLPAGPDVLVRHGIQIIDIEYRQLKDRRIESFIRSGISCAVWTVDDIGDMKRMLDAGVSFITTNKPDSLIELLDDPKQV